MASEIKSWQIVDGKLVPVQSSLSASGRRERDDLEVWIRSDPTILGEDVLIIGEQVQTASGPLDFLGMDRSGNTVIIELKRDKLAREALVQAIDYASDLSEWDIERFREICLAYTKQTFEDVFQQRFEGSLLEDLSINQTQRILLVGFSVEESLGRMIEWLSDKYSVGINAVLLSYVRTAKGEEVLSRTAIISEEVEKHNFNRHKYIIEMSDTPGNYDRKELENKLTDYLTKSLYSSQRLRDYFLPILLEKGKVSRDELRKEFVKRGAAPDESQAGYFLSLISSQLAHKGKDYLRQVVSYEYPNHPWEKDNFSINKDSRELTERVLEKLRKTTQQIVGVVALSGLLFRTDVAAVVRFALVIRRRNSTLCYAYWRMQNEYHCFGGLYYENASSPERTAFHSSRNALQP